MTYVLSQVVSTDWRSL